MTVTGFVYLEFFPLATIMPRIRGCLLGSELLRILRQIFAGRLPFVSGWSLPSIHVDCIHLTKKIVSRVILLIYFEYDT